MKEKPVSCFRKRLRYPGLSYAAAATSSGTARVPRSDPLGGGDGGVRENQGGDEGVADARLDVSYGLHPGGSAGGATDGDE
ncbi:MAG: hypothetical protein ABSG63_16555 [Spirochaetia bacterium]|jgi:hypothetical protein